MKNILTKLNIHPSTYVLFLISFLCGYFKPVIILFLIIIVHESGHVITSKLLGYNIISVNIYPFGGITKIDKPLNSSIKKDMLIAISGVLMQLLLFLFIKDPTNRNYNLTIILFNLLPLIPPGDNYLFFTAERGYPNPIFKWRSRYWSFLLKLSPDKPSWTIQASFSNNQGPFHWKNRFLRIPEIQRIQTFPDTYVFKGKFADQWRQIGNAVPPLLIQRIAHQIKKLYF